MVSEVALTICHTDEEIKDFVIKLLNQDTKSEDPVVTPEDIERDRLSRYQKDILGGYLEDCLVDDLNICGDNNTLDSIENHIIYVEALHKYCD